MTTTTLRIACYGVQFDAPVIDVNWNGFQYSYLLDEQHRAEAPCHVGLFMDQSAMSERVLEYPRDQRICALIESPINNCYSDIETLVERFPIIFTHQQSLFDRGKLFRKFFFGTNWLGIRNRHDIERTDRLSVPKSHNVSFIGSIQHKNFGAYNLRREVAEFLVEHGKVDCFGKGIRAIQGKAEALAPYRFSIAMENAASNFYFSEKLVDCLLLQTVPIYYGCSGITEVLDARGLLVFQTIEELSAILDRLSPELYKQMLPFAMENRKRAVEQEWYAHSSLFQRLTESIHFEVCKLPPVTLLAPSLLARTIRRIRKSLNLH